MPRADVRGNQSWSFHSNGFCNARVTEMWLGRTESCENAVDGKPELKKLRRRGIQGRPIRPTSATHFDAIECRQRPRKILPAFRYVSRGADMSPIDTANSCALVQSLLRFRCSSARS